MTGQLELLTFEALVSTIDEQARRARVPETVEGWKKLLGVARELAGADSEGDDPALGRHWSLISVIVSGYQGIAPGEPLEIRFDPTPGITVLHGPNGSGKSSIADAIETVLHGEPRRAVDSGTGGRALLWERVHTGRDAPEAVIEVELTAKDERLRLRCKLDKNGEALEQSCEIQSSGMWTAVDLRATTWGSALAGHRPVFGYAAVERQVQRSKDLQDFLESLLAFGGCFETFKHQVELRGQSSRAALRDWKQALATAQQRVIEVDNTHSRDGEAGLPNAAWPSIEVDPDQWLAAQELTDIGLATVEVTDDHYRRLAAAGAKASAALMALLAAETSLRARLATPLKQLHGAASGIDHDGTECPVCVTHGIDWFAALSGSVQHLADLSSLESTFAVALGSLTDAIDSDLASVHAVLKAHARPDSGPLPGEDVATALGSAVATDGRRPTPQVRESLAGICEWIDSDPCREAIADAKAQSDLRRQWLRARRGAVNDFIDVWRRVKVDALEAPAWDSAAARLSALQQTLRTERAQSLQTLTGERVRRLLSDAGLDIKDITVQGTKASIRVVDKADKEMTLAMLSAGQRNALLLSPLLAAASSGPFAFLILDDPVHAFDQLRVDRLAAVLEEMARERRIIVMTHDERLREHLAAREVACDVRVVERDPLTGVVSATVQGQMWSVLLDDADAALTLDTSAGPVPMGRTDIIRGLCRQAVDDAIRQFVVRACVVSNRDSGAHLEALDVENTTRDRLVAAQGMFDNLPDMCHVVASARGLVASYLDHWNRAAHGNAPIAEAEAAEIEAARAASIELVGGGA